MPDNRKLERINIRISSRLELHSRIKTYRKNAKVVRQNITNFRNKVPLLRRHGIRNDLKNSAIDTMSKGEDHTSQGIILINKGVGTAKATIRTGVSVAKVPVQVGKIAYRLTKLTIRTGKRLAGKKFALDPQFKESLFSKLNKHKKPKKKKPGLLSQAKDAGNNLLQIQKDDTSNTGVASIQQALNTRRQIRPYSNIAKKATKVKYNVFIKKPVVAISRRNQYNALQALRTKQRELKYGKNSINTSSQLGKIKTLKDRQRVKIARKNLAQKLYDKKGIRATTRAATNATKSLLKIMTNPLVMKFVALVGIVIIFVSIISGILGAFFPVAGTVMIDEKTIIKYGEKVSKLNDDFQKNIDKLMNDSKYDDHVIHYSSEDRRMEVRLVEILAIVAVKYEQNLKFSWSEKSTVDDLFQFMLSYSTNIDSYYCSGCEPVYPSPTPSSSSSPSIQSSSAPSSTQTPQPTGYTCPGHKRINIYIQSRDMEEAMIKMGFDEGQKEWARILATSDLAAMFPDVPGLSSEL